MASGTAVGLVTHVDRMPRPAVRPARGWSVGRLIRRVTSGATAAPITAWTEGGAPTRGPGTNGRDDRHPVVRTPALRVPARTWRPSAGR